MKLVIIHIIILFSLACSFQANAAEGADETTRMQIVENDNDEAKETTTKWTVKVSEKEGAAYVAKTLYKRYGGTAAKTAEGSTFYIGTFQSQKQANDFCKNVITPQFPKAKVISTTPVQ